MNRWFTAALNPGRSGDCVRFAGPFVLAALLLVPWYWFQGPIAQIVVGQFWAYSAVGTLLVTAWLIVYRTVKRRRLLRTWGPLLLEARCVGRSPFQWTYGTALVAGLLGFYSLMLADADGGEIIWLAALGMSFMAGMTLSVFWFGTRRLELFEPGLVLAGYWEVEWPKVVSARCHRAEALEVTLEHRASQWQSYVSPLQLSLSLNAADRFQELLDAHCPQAIRLADTLSGEPLRVRRQFQLKHAFVAMLPAAVFFALVGPWFRRLEPSGRWAVVTFWGTAFVWTAFYFWTQLQVRRGVLRQWGEPELALRQPKRATERYRTMGWLLAAALYLLFYTFLVGPTTARQSSLFQRLVMGLPLGMFAAQALASLWFDEFLIEVFPRALVLGESRVFAFQSIVGYDLRKYEHLELLLEYTPPGKVWGGNRYVAVRLPPDRGPFFAALLDERCPGIGRTKHFRNRYPEATGEPDADDDVGDDSD